MKLLKQVKRPTLRTCEQALLDKGTRALGRPLAAWVLLSRDLCRAERRAHFEKLCCVLFKQKIHDYRRYVILLLI